MNVATKLVGFLVALLVVFGGAVGLGKAVGPVDPVATPEHEVSDEGNHADMDMEPETDPDTEESSTTTSYPKGLMVSQDGYTFRLAETTVAPGTAVPVTFTIEDPDGRAVTEYDVEHDKELHLIAVRRDFSGFQHVHPEMDSAGTWKAELDFTAGQWRLFADFKATGSDALTLGTDVAVRGNYRPSALAADTRTSMVGGYEVTLGGDLTAGEDAKLNLSVARDGEPVTDLEPYLGAYGHLVALRAGDLAYLQDRKSVV